jgi:hypothetical protein
LPAALTTSEMLAFVGNPSRPQSPEVLNRGRTPTLRN